MNDITASTTEVHTLVCDQAEESARDSSHSASLRALISHYIQQDPRSQSELSALLRISRRQLGRILSGKKPLRLAEIKVLSDVLGIDRARAVVAIEVLGNWQSYDDPGLCIMMRILQPVVTKLNERAEFLIEPLTGPAEELLSDWLANSIITNEKQIRNRRDEFVKLPQI